MKIFALLAGVSLSLSPCAFSQQLIAESIASPSANPGMGSILTLGSNASTLQYGIAVGVYASADYGGIAIGSGSQAGQGSIALGGRALGGSSTALGSLTVAEGVCSVASGYAICASSDYSIALGSKNLSFPSDYVYGVGGDGWNEDAVLFELGNGTPNGQDYAGGFIYDLSNAITTLKNGRTTLTNKAWFNRDSSVSPTADPSPETTDSEGEALVVEGHTRLKGKVTIEQPQGDISMGIYQ